VLVLTLQVCFCQHALRACDCANWILLVLAAHFSSCMSDANASIAQLQQSFNPIPGWREVANSYDTVTGEFKIPFVGFSFNSQVSWTSGNNTKYLVPDQIKINTGFVPGASPQPPQAFRMVDEVSDFQVAQLNNGTGHFGWLGGLNDPAQLYSAYYGQGVSLAVYQVYYPIYSLNLTEPNSGVNVTLSKYAAAALESLPPVYDATTEAVFDLFIDTFGTAMATISLRGGGIEDVMGWASCIWKGRSPQQQDFGTFTSHGTKDCVLDDDNYQEMVLAKNFSGRGTVVSSAKYGGDPTITDPDAWAKTITDAPVVIEYEAHTRLSDLLGPSMNATAAALEQAIVAYEQQQVSSVQQAASKLRAQQNTQARNVLFETDVSGVCKSGGLAPGQSWSVQCGPSIAPFTQNVDMIQLAPPPGAAPDGTAGLQIEGGGDEVTCGCSTLPIDVMRSTAAANKSSGSSSCSTQGKVEYVGNTAVTIDDVDDEERCCDLCNAHHSCLFWTLNLKKKTCDLKVAKSIVQCCDPSKTVGQCPKSCYDVLVSGSRSGDVPPQDYAHFCFDCALPSALAQRNGTTDNREALGFPL